MNWLVAGLGNPGTEYEQTRHNVGFMVIDKLADIFGITVKRLECRSLIGQTNIGADRVELVKPQTYMNLSGEAISCLLTDDSRSVDNLIVIVDDLALPFGSIRIRGKGSAGGHNGLKSINHCLKTENYTRLRIGISPEHPLSNTRKFVLDRFSSKDRKELDEIVKISAEAVETMISDGIDRAMSRFNS